ncbi:trafficking protein particle complex subunit 11 [Prunus yedoensis var. nudiflora]|uniref:Trafficking protein particle complex subunit 11 n=1 Tax=Prunus yedoensis var. nudiflora TaxID=2094558 RepID=A0A315ALU5_PRUYE|nr:trafficking protein particle complex subunit 11 [Prunus yedoensis var. nudiflora]
MYKNQYYSFCGPNVWVLKHRTKVPSVVAALLSSVQVSGDPDEISVDQMVAVRKRADVDAKYLLTFYQNPDGDSDGSQLKESLYSLGSVFVELASKYYRDEGRRIKARIERKSSNPSELNIRYLPDWAEALRFYEDAYHTLRELIAGTSYRGSAIQHLVEIKTVAEQLHFKISTLLLHGGKIIEAVARFRQHNTSYRKLLAGHYLKEKRSSLEFAVSMSEGETDCSAESVVPSSYLSQFARLIEQGDAFVMQPLNDEECMRYAISEGKKFQDSFEIFALLKKSCDSYQ